MLRNSRFTLHDKKGKEMSDDFVYIDENHRLGFDYEEGSENPRKDWDMLTGFVTIRNDSRSIDVEPVHSDSFGIAEAHERLENVVYERKGRLYNAGRGYNSDVAELVQRWAKIFHNAHIEWDSEHGGYWFVDPAKFAENWTLDENGEVERFEQDRDENGKYLPTRHSIGKQNALAIQAEVIDGERKTYEAWANGEVYSVYGQTRTIEHVKVTNPESGEVLREFDREEWDTTDSIGGIYMDDESFEDMVRNVAKDYFGDEYTKKENANG